MGAGANSRPLPTRLALGLTILTLTLCGCVSGAGPAARSSEATVAPAAPAAPKHLTIGILAEPESFYRALIPPGHQGQSGDVADLVTGGLTVADDHGTIHPQLAAAVPTLENGGWQLLPDGRMELTWKIAPGARWHDGTPFTADDLLFTSRLANDADLPEFHTRADELVAEVRATDPQTVVVIWKQPYIWADRMYSSRSSAFATPLPRHLLEEAYRANKEGFRQLPYWSQQYVGTGAYRVREMAPGSHVMLEANDRYVRGRPKIDQIEVRFFTDANTLTAGLLANAVDLTLGSSLALEQALAAKEQWGSGGLAINYSSWIVVFPQFLNPTPRVVLDVRFRRALLYATDRKAMADEIQAGMVPVADSYVSPNEPEYQATKDRAVVYGYDPARAAQLLGEIGYQRLPDGGWRDSAGQRLSLEVRSTASPAIHTKAFFPLVDYWKRLGLDIDPVVIPVQRLADLEYRTTMPSFEMIRFPNGAENVWRLHSSQAPLPENRFNGSNRSRFINPEFDGLIDRYLTTIPWNERMRVLGDLVHEISDQLIMMGLFYDVKSFMVANRLTGFTPADNATWNCETWDVGVAAGPSRS